jgi:tripeptide aminopeptidase
MGATAQNGNLAAIVELPGMRDRLNWFSKQKQWINDRHLQLCRVAAPTFFEQKRAEWMAAQFGALGWKADLDRAGNVVAQFDTEGDGSLVALTAHLDTVLAPRNQDEVAVTPDGIMHGPGVSDNGAGLAALLAMAAVLRAFPKEPENASKLVLIANVGEEGEGNLSGMRYVCKQSPLAGRVSSFLILDGPNTDHITSQALASRRFDITLTGPGGHSWSDYGTSNPIHALSRAITLFSDQNGAGPPRSSYNFGVVEGGSSINSIAATARAKVDIRSESSAKLGELAALLSACVEQAIDIENGKATAGRITAKIKEIGSRPGGALPPDAPLLNVIRAVDVHLGIRSRLDCASTDANIPLSLGLQAISIGAGGQGGGAHTPAEWFSPEGREFGLRRILLTLHLLLRDLA